MPSLAPIDIGRALLAISLIASAPLCSPAAAQQRGDVTPGIERLIAGYNTVVSHRDGNVLVLRSGQRITIDSGRQNTSHESMLANADIVDMLSQTYTPGRLPSPPQLNFDPGRARPQAFFNAIYGDCTRGEVEKNLVDVVWLPKKSGKPLKFSKINGAAERLAAVSRELDTLPAAFDAFLFPSAGTYVCRPIAGTARVSAHGHGIAIDIAVAKTDYWQWAGHKPGRAIPYKNRIPFEIVEIFERHGFVWGGKWYHYDTMHFEFRPELMPPSVPLQ